MIDKELNSLAAPNVNRSGPGPPRDVMSKPPITLAVAQSRITADIRENGREVRDLMRQARSEGAALLQFPEGVMSGCSKG